MRMLLVRTVAAVCASTLSLHALPAAAQSAPSSWTPELTLTVKRLPTVVPSPDGTRVAFVVGEAVMEGERSEWVNQIHLAAADGSGSRQITRGDKSSSDPRWSPDGEGIGLQPHDPHPTFQPCLPIRPFCRQLRSLPCP